MLFASTGSESTNPFGTSQSSVTFATFAADKVVSASFAESRVTSPRYVGQLLESRPNVMCSFTAFPLMVIEPEDGDAG